MLNSILPTTIAVYKRNLSSLVEILLLPINIVRWKELELDSSYVLLSHRESQEE